MNIGNITSDNFNLDGNGKDIQIEVYEQLIEKLQQENKQLKEQLEYLRSGEYYNQLRFENEMLQQVVDTNGVPSEVYDYIDCTHRNTELLKENQELKKENKQLKERIAYLERSNNRREDTILEQRQEISDLEDNWNKLKEYIRKNIIYDDVGMKILDPSSLEDYIQELEQGSDSNE